MSGNCLCSASMRHLVTSSTSRVVLCGVPRGSSETRLRSELLVGGKLPAVLRASLDSNDV